MVKSNNENKDNSIKIIKIEDIVIDKEFANAWDIDDTILKSIKEDIKEKGYYNNLPILLWKNPENEEMVLIDGHTRVKALKELKIESVPYLIDKSCKNREDVLELIFKLQFKRRDITDKDILKHLKQTKLIDKLIDKNGKKNFIKPIEKRFAVKTKKAGEIVKVYFNATPDQLEKIYKKERTIASVYDEITDKERKDKSIKDEATEKLDKRYKSYKARKKIVLPIKEETINLTIGKETKMSFPIKKEFKEPQSESEVIILFNELTTLFPDLFDFTLLDYNANQGIDCIARYNPEDKSAFYVEFKKKLQPGDTINHLFEKLGKIIVYDIYIDSQKEDNPLSDVAKIKGKLRKVEKDKFSSNNESFKGKIYTGYELNPEPTSISSIQVIVLRDILTKVIGAEIT